MSKSELIIPIQSVEQAIFLIRGQKVMLDRDLAAFYGVDTKAVSARYAATGTDFQVISCLN